MEGDGQTSRRTDRSQPGDNRKGKAREKTIQRSRLCKGMETRQHGPCLENTKRCGRKCTNCYGGRWRDGRLLPDSLQKGTARLCPVHLSLSF